MWLGSYTRSKLGISFVMATEQSKDVEMKDSEMKASEDEGSEQARGQKDKDLLTYEGGVLI